MLIEKKKIIKRIRIEWRDLTSEYESLKSIEMKALKFFNEEVSSKAKEQKIKLEFESINEEKEANNKASEEEVKIIFREIAKKAHPDISKEKNEDIFIEASKAKKEGEISKLIDNALKLNVDIESISFSQIEKMEHEVEELKKKIKNIINSVHWKWYHENNKNKKILIQKILNNIKNVK